MLPQLRPSAVAGHDIPAAPRCPGLKKSSPRWRSSTPVHTSRRRVTARATRPRTSAPCLVHGRGPTMSRASVATTGIWSRRELADDEVPPASRHIGGKGTMVSPLAAPRNLPLPLGDLSARHPLPSWNRCVHPSSAFIGHAGEAPKVHPEGCRTPVGFRREHVAGTLGCQWLGHFRGAACLVESSPNQELDHDQRADLVGGHARHCPVCADIAP